MTGHFNGAHTFKVDPKGRVSIPADFRRVLAEGDPDCTDGECPRFVLVLGLSDQQMLEGMTVEKSRQIAAAIARMPRKGKEKRLAQLRYQANSVTLQVDPNGRLVLPLNCREKAGITNQAKFVGMGDAFEVWSEERFSADYDALDAEATSGEEGEALQDSMHDLLDAAMYGDEA